MLSLLGVKATDRSQPKIQKIRRIGFIMYDYYRYYISREKKSTNPIINTKNVEIQHVDVRPSIAQVNTFPIASHNDNRWHHQHARITELPLSPTQGSQLPGSVDGEMSVEDSRPGKGSDTDDGQDADILDMSQSLVSLDSNIDQR